MASSALVSALRGAGGNESVMSRLAEEWFDSTFDGRDWSPESGYHNVFTLFKNESVKSRLVDKLCARLEALSVMTFGCSDLLGIVNDMNNMSVRCVCSAAGRIGVCGQVGKVPGASLLNPAPFPPAQLLCH